MKYHIMYQVTLPFDLEVDASSSDEAKEIARNLQTSDVLQAFAEQVMDYSNGEVNIESVMKPNGEYIYDGIGTL